MYAKESSESTQFIRDLFENATTSDTLINYLCNQLLLYLNSNVSVDECTEALINKLRKDAKYPKILMFKSIESKQYTDAELTLCAVADLFQTKVVWFCKNETTVLTSQAVDQEGQHFSSVWVTESLHH